MSNRLDQEREKQLQPQRIKSCKIKLEELGFIVSEVGETELRFLFNGNIIKFWPYSGWYTGKNIKDGRGFNNLLKQLNLGGKR